MKRYAYAPFLAIGLMLSPMPIHVDEAFAEDGDPTGDVMSDSQFPTRTDSQDFVLAVGSIGFRKNRKSRRNQ